MSQQPPESSEPAPFEDLYRDHASPIFRFLRRILKSRAAAEDVTQDTFFHFWRQSASVKSDHGRSPRAYLFGIARRKAVDDYRRSRDTVTLSDPTLSEPAASATSPSLLILDALDQLDIELRTILWLREVEGYSYQELAARLDIPLGTVRSRLHAARRQLRLIWTKETP